MESYTLYQTRFFAEQLLLKRPQSSIDELASTMQGTERVEPLDQWRFAYTDDGVCITYNIQWKDAERQRDIFVRKDDSLLQKWLEQAISVPVPTVTLRFKHTNSPDHKISYLESHPSLKGALSVDKLIYTGFENEEYLVYSIIAEDGTEIDEDMVNVLWNYLPR